MNLKTSRPLLKSRVILLFACVLAFVQALSNEGVASGFLAQISKMRPSTLLSSISITKIYLPLMFNNYIAPPPTTTSRYMHTTDSTTLYNEGCSQGLASPDDSVVILDFGKPWYENSSYGTRFSVTYTFASISQIENATKRFLAGYWVCAPEGKHITLGIGTNNSGSYTNAAHGQLWAEMVSRVDSWIKAPPSYEDKESVVGASDIEPGFNDPLSSRAWANSYAAVYTRPYYNYGSCDGCPSFNCPRCIPGGGPYVWKVDDVWYVSWGALPAYPLPEIYSTDGVTADQWYRMSLYAYNTYGQRMNILGAFTQWQACQGKVCPETDNTPEAGYEQLYQALNADPNTAQKVGWSTDITWKN